jgi:hypothetical protein
LFLYFIKALISPAVIALTSLGAILNSATAMA